MWILLKTRLWKFEFCEKWELEKVNFVKKWDSQYVNFSIFAPVWVMSFLKIQIFIQSFIITVCSFWSSSKGSRDRHKSLTNGAKKVSLILHPPSSSHNGKRFIWEELEAAVGDDGKKTFGSGQIDKLKNGTMYNNGVSIYRLLSPKSYVLPKHFFSRPNWEAPTKFSFWGN